MRRSTRIVLLLAALTVALAVAIGCGGGGSSSLMGPSPGGSADVVITINGNAGGMSFSPATANVQTGQTVAWRNADSSTHTATRDFRPSTRFSSDGARVRSIPVGMRVTRPGGVNLHFFPGRYCPIEQHVLVPLATLIRSNPWLVVWAHLGVRNPFQEGPPAREGRGGSRS